MQEIMVVDGPVSVPAKDIWCKTGGLKKFVGLGLSTIRAHVADMEASGAYDDKIIVYPGGMRLVNLAAFIDYLVATQSLKALKVARKNEKKDAA